MTSHQHLIVGAREETVHIHVCAQCRAYLFVKNDTGEEQFEKI